MSRSSAWRAVMLALAAAAATSLTVGVTTAHADPVRIPLSPVEPTAAENGLISYYDNDNTVFAANPDGTQVRTLFSGARGAPAWSPDGSRFAYSNSSHQIRSRRFDGTGDLLLAGSGRSPEWSHGGTLVFFENGARIHFVTADGAFLSEPLFEPGACSDAEPTVAPNGDLVFSRLCPGDTHTRLFHFDLQTGQVAELIARGWGASYSPDGARLVYHVSENDEIWIANADGTNPQLLVTGARHADWSPDGSSVIYAKAEPGATLPQLTRIDMASKEITPLGLRGTEVSWQPLEINFVDRVWGQDHVETGIATSKYNYATDGEPGPQAQAVVLSRDDTFLDALVGSAFAIKEQAPLLVTNRAALDSRVEGEIRRILGNSGTVYLLGGELALAPAVENRLRSLGFSVVRIGGQTHFDTAIAINRRITDAPHTAIITTGINFYDALAAGAAAGANPGTVIVLTNGTEMPASSASYLNGLNPDHTAPNGTAMVTAGGPGNTAFLRAYSELGQMPSWPDRITYFPLVGENEKDTALLIARGFFAAPTSAAIATNQTWFDALTGGAMIGFNGGPLLITDPTALYGPLHTYLVNNAGNLWVGAMLGGPAALPKALEAPIGNAISLPFRWRYKDYTATQPGATTAAKPAAVRGAVRPAPDVPVHTRGTPATISR